MVKVAINGVQRYYDGYTVSNLDQLKKAVALKWDGILLYGGYEGDGKTTKCAQDLAYLDPTFNIDRVCFDLDTFDKLTDTLPPGSAIQYDESWIDTSNSARLQVNQRRLINILTRKRFKRFYIGIISATFFDLNKYFVIHRSRAYIHVYTDGLERGYFSFYNRQQKQDLYIKGRRDWNLRAAEPSFRGRFTNWLPFDSEEYERRKTAATLKMDEEQGKKYDLAAYRDGQDEVLLYLRDVAEIFKRGEHRGLFTKIAQHLQITPEALERRVTKYRLTREKRRVAKENALHDTLIPKTYRLTKREEDEPLEMTL